jgi:signal transduction histidine kinase/ActR/RegA family two-component response regulator
VFRIVEEGVDRNLAPMGALVDHTVRHRREAMLVSRDGSTRAISSVGSPIRDREGIVTGVVLVFRDISEARAAEQERNRLLAAEQAARAEAEDANRAKDDFLAILSHELRTPLTAILGWSQLLLQDRTSEEELAEGLRIIEQNAVDQNHIVRDLLDVSSIVRGKLVLNVESLDLMPLVRASIDACRLAAQARNISIEHDLPSVGRCIRGDAVRLQQVIWNLLSNAVKFTDPGGRIRISVERDDVRVKLSVTDTGIGIKPDFLPYVFDRFRQADSSRTRKYGGLGLGLAIARHMVELHGGTIEARSDGENCGSTFTVYLPRYDEPEGAPTEPGGPSDLCQVRVLVIEDEASTRELIRRILVGAGADVITAGDAQEGLELLRQHRPMVLVCDISMPTDDGYSLIRKVRMLGAEDGGQTPAVALTAHAGQQDRAMAVEAGFQVHLPKPIDQAALVAAIAKLASAARAASASGQ